MEDYWLTISSYWTGLVRLIAKEGPRVHINGNASVAAQGSSEIKQGRLVPFVSISSTGIVPSVIIIRRCSIQGASPPQTQTVAPAGSSSLREAPPQSAHFLLSGRMAEVALITLTVWILRRKTRARASTARSNVRQRACMSVVCAQSL